MQYAWEKNDQKGSSTLVIVTLPEQGNEMYSSYIGDSSFMILRDSAKKGQHTDVFYVSEP